MSWKALSVIYIEAYDIEAEKVYTGDTREEVIAVAEKGLEELLAEFQKRGIPLTRDTVEWEIERIWEVADGPAYH